MRCLDGTSDAMDMNWGELRAMVQDRQAWRAAVRGATESRARPGDRASHLRSPHMCSIWP